MRIINRGKKVILLSGLILLTSTPSYASLVCRAVFAELHRFSLKAFELDTTLPPGKAAPVEHIIEPLYTGGKGRGFLSSFPAVNAETMKVAASLSYRDWGQSILLVESAAEARVYEKAMKSFPIDSPLYVINGMSVAQREALVPVELKNSDFVGLGAGEKQALEARTAAENRRREELRYRAWLEMMNHPEGDPKLTNIAYIGKDGNFHYLSKKEASRFFFLENSFMDRMDEGVRLFHFYQKGWFFPPQRGVIEFVRLFFDRHEQPKNYKLKDEEKGIYITKELGLNEKMIQILYKQDISFLETPELQEAYSRRVISTFSQIMAKHSQQLAGAFKTYKGLPDAEKQNQSLLSFLEGQFNIARNPDPTAEINLQPGLEKYVEFFLAEVFAVEAHNAQVKSAKERRKAIVKFAQRLFSKGPLVDTDGDVTSEIYFLFNSNMRAAVELARDTDRKGQGQAAGRGRFNEDTVKNYSALMEQGKAYTIEVYNQDGKLIVSLFGDINNGTFNGRSPGYRNFPDHRGFGIEMAKLLKQLQFELFAKAGFTWQDVGGLTNFTQGLGAGLVPVSQYIQMKEQSMNQNPVGFRDVPWPNQAMPLSEVIELIQ